MTIGHDIHGVAGVWNGELDDREFWPECKPVFPWLGKTFEYRYLDARSRKWHIGPLHVTLNQGSGFERGVYCSVGRLTAFFGAPWTVGKDDHDYYHPTLFRIYVERGAN